MRKIDGVYAGSDQLAFIANTITATAAIRSSFRHFLNEQGKCER
jgi:hypothetical protein